MPTRRTKLKVDARGDFRPYIGKRKDGKQPRFNLGSSEAEAALRADRIRKLYEECEVVRLSYDQPTSWTEAALHAADFIRRGHSQVPLPSPHVINEAAGNGPDIGGHKCDWPDSGNTGALLWSHAVASRHYPSVNWILPDNAAGRVAKKTMTAIFDDVAGKQARLLGTRSTLQPVSGTLHEALDVYSAYVGKIAGITAGTRFHRQDQVKYLKRTHSDQSLASLGFSECGELYGFWAALPVKADGTVYAASTRKHRVSELNQFFKWLHLSDEFAWRKPEDFELIDRKIKKKSGKRKSIREIQSKDIFEIEHLATINRHCQPLERLLLYLGLNCCFGAAESGRLEFEDIYLHQKNPIEYIWAPLKFTSSEDDSWIGFLRPKSEVAGMWWLWPETVDALKQWEQERPVTKEELVIVKSTGISLYREETKNGQSEYRKLWEAVRKKVQAEDNSIPWYPFGALRDHFSNWLVAKNKSVLSSIALAHGNPFADDLMKCYSNRPFPDLFAEQKLYREFLKPMFDAVE